MYVCVQERKENERYQWRERERERENTFELQPTAPPTSCQRSPPYAINHCWKRESLRWIQSLALWLHTRERPRHHFEQSFLKEFIRSSQVLGTRSYISECSVDMFLPGKTQTRQRHKTNQNNIVFLKFVGIIWPYFCMLSLYVTVAICCTQESPSTTGSGLRVCVARSTQRQLLEMLQTSSG